MNINQGLKNQVKIVFFGTSDFAVTALKYLVQNGYYIAGVFTQPEKLVGRQRITMPSPVKKAALGSNALVLEPHTLKDDETFRHFKHLDPDICIIASYGKIIPSRYLEIPKYGFLNIHPSLLPKYRGPSPIQTAILNGDNKTGVTIIKLDEEIDHGKILSSKLYLIPSTLYYAQIEKELAELGGELLLEVLPEYINGRVKLTEQEHDKAVFTKKFGREDGKIIWSEPVEIIYNRVKALSHEPGTWCWWENKILNIIKAEIHEKGTKGESGKIISHADKRITVQTGKGSLELLTVQLEGGRVTDIKDFLNGHQNFASSILR